ncbi:glycosyltransferase family 2 protein [Desulfotomaculum sp. 1211_IL3151]|uniref:glycosyltransferase family 2 protein n=1 Tax=Desulfotomaculum sp. 1211_IL3151 TaxID=3084055 RepID=UPI002FDAD3C9
MKAVSIVCPVYNEEEGIQRFYNELKKVTSRILGYDFEFVFVVDKSRDKTWKILSGLAEEDTSLKLLLLSRRFGHQMSLVAGIDQCRDADAIIMMDSDLQHPPALIPEMLKKYEQGYEIVYTIRDDSENIGFIKRNVSKAFYNLINRISDVEVHASSSDFRLISRKVAEIFRKEIREPNQFLRGLFSWVGFNSTAIQFTTEKREFGRSKYNLKTMIRLALAGVLSFSTVPLRLAISMGLVIAMASFAFGVYYLIKYFTFGISVTGWTSLGLLISFLGGLQLVFLGVIGLYIGGIFEAVKNRPLYLVEAKKNC